MEERPCDDQGSSWKDAATSPGAPGAPAAGRGREGPPPSPHREQAPLQEVPGVPLLTTH